MRGIEFPEANKKLLPPEGEEANVYTLHVWSDGNRCISKWKMTWQERFKALFTGTIWFDSWGSTHPPINLMVRYPFERELVPIWKQWKFWVILPFALLLWVLPFLPLIIGALT